MSKKRARGPDGDSRRGSDAASRSGRPPEGGRVTIGTATFDSVKNVTSAIENHATMSRFSLAIEALKVSSADYRGRVTSSIPEVGGYVVRADPATTDVNLIVTSGTVLDETRIPFLAHSGMSAAELIWAMTQIGGLPDSSQFIEGFAKRPATFAVVMPVAGMSSDRAYQIGPVAISGDRAGMAVLLANTGDPVHIGAFLGQSAWAVIEVDAGTVWEAETSGVERIELALDRLALVAQYSMATVRRVNLCPSCGTLCSRNSIAIPLVLVAEKPAGTQPRRWLRDRTASVKLLPVGDPRIRLRTPALKQSGPFNEAIRAWRRAVLTNEPLGAVLALWEAIDFYASGVSVPCLNESECRALRAAMHSVALSEDQRRRVDDLFATINEAPLMTRLRAALDLDKVPHTEEDLSVLKRLRRHRNDALHGRERGRPDINDLDIARGLVNRMIVFWAAGPRLAEQEQ